MRASFRVGEPLAAPGVNFKQAANGRARNLSGFHTSDGLSTNVRQWPHNVAAGLKPGDESDTANHYQQG
jgi:hypothetical protein